MTGVMMEVGVHHPEMMGTAEGSGQIQNFRAGTNGTS